MLSCQSLMHANVIHWTEWTDYAEEMFISMTNIGLDIILTKCKKSASHINVGNIQYSAQKLTKQLM